MAETVFKKLLAPDRQVLGILREGALMFDLRAVDNKDIPFLAEVIGQMLHDINE